MTQQSDKSWIVFLSTFPPRECGIATFSNDLLIAFDDLYVPREESRVVALNPSLFTRYTYPKKVLFSFNAQKIEEYKSAAERLNEKTEVKLVSIQHEYGIFGGEYGSHLIEFLRHIKKPTVITLHTVLPEPNPDLRHITKEVLSLVDKIVVMTDSAKDLISREYEVPRDKIVVIPHGIHDIAYVESTNAKKELGFNKKTTIITTFGLVGEGKGLEYGIEALPKVIKEFPNTTYLIIGATHPEVLKREGEKYREMLVKKIEDLGLENNVIFYNKYLETKQLLKFLQATDIYLSLSQNPHQAVSGTLSYALGTGRPVVSTPFAQAREEITPDVGALVDFKDPDKIADALLVLLGDTEARNNMGRNAYFRTRRQTWHNVALSYMKEYISLVPEIGRKEKNLPSITLKHVRTLTDTMGILQFARLEEPDPTSGYTVDDNARALMSVLLYHEEYEGIVPIRLAHTYLNFLEYCIDSNGQFRNYVNHNKTFNNERNTSENLEDATARGYYALAFAASRKKAPQIITQKAEELFKQHCNFSKKVASPRAVAAYIKALCCMLRVDKENDDYKKNIIEYANFLVSLYEAHSSPDWQWFEGALTYSNAVLSDALCEAYCVVGDERYLDVGKKTLDFLVHNSFSGEMYVPIGQDGWFKKGGEKRLYDQQPEEVSTTVRALKVMYEITKDEKYKRKMISAFQWFLGNNTANQVVYSHISGGCFDGIGKGYVNLNQGAESTLMYLLARLAVDE